MRKRVYVAGPLSSTGDPYHNTQVAIDLGNRLIARGYAPFIPHLSYYMDPEGARFPHATWLDVDLAWLAQADAVYLLTGWEQSKGAVIEYEYAREHAIPTATSLHELDVVLQGRRAREDREVILPFPKGHPGDHVSGSTNAAPTVLGEITHNTLTKQQMAALMEETFARLRKLREAGQQEYAHADDDAFGNFHAVARDLGLDRKLVAWIYAAKHIRGIVAYLNGHESQREDVEGRIDDLEQYLELIRGMIRCDKQAAAPAEPAAAENGGLLRRFSKRD